MDETNNQIKNLESPQTVIHERHIYLKERKSFIKNFIQGLDKSKSTLHPFGCFMYTIEPFPDALTHKNDKTVFPDKSKEFYNNPDLLLRFRVSVCQPEDQFNYKKSVELVREKFKNSKIKYIENGANIKLENNQIVSIKDLYRTLILQGDFYKHAYRRFSTDDLYPKFLKNIRYFNNRVLPEWIEKGFIK